MTGLRNSWEGWSIEAFKTWFINKDIKKIKALALNVAWGIWLARNLKLRTRDISPQMCNLVSRYTKCISIGKEKTKNTRDKKRSHQWHSLGILLWCLWKASPKGDSLGIMYLSSNHSIAFKVWIRKETNNHCYSMLAKGSITHTFLCLVTI